MMRTTARRFSKRLASVLMAGVLAAGMIGVTAFAEDGDQQEVPKKVTITKNITKRSDVYAPNTEFTFTVTPGQKVDASDTQKAIYAGLTGGVTFAEGANKIASTPKDGDIGETTVKAGETNLTVNENVFANAEAGIYRYVVKETAGNYEGISYTNEEKYFDVYVDGDHKVYAYTFVTDNTSTAKDDGIFENDYNKGHTPDVPGNDPVSDLTITKKVEGTQGDKSKKFKFTIKVAGANGEKYYVKDANGTKIADLTSNEPKEIELKNSDSAIITGLSKSDSYTVTETDYSADGYSTTVQVGSDSAKNAREATGTITNDTTITVTNKKDVQTPTGIILTYAPYILMIALAGAMAFFFLRRRNEEI